MKIIKPGFEFITPIDGSVILKRELQQIVPVCFDDILPKEANHETS